MDGDLHVSKKKFNGTCVFCGAPAEAARQDLTALAERPEVFVVMWVLAVNCAIHHYIALDYDSEVEDPFDKDFGNDEEPT